MTAPGAVCAVLLLAPVATPPPPAPPLPSFEQMWSTFVRADAAGDRNGAEQALRAIRRARVERNVDSLDTVGLGMVARGAARLAEGQRDEAEESFRTAVALAPGLPDGHAGLAVALMKKGPLGVVPSVNAAAAGSAAFLPTGRGALSGATLATLGALLAAFGFAWALGAALLMRHGGLLRHDVDEWLGPAQSRSASLALFLLLALLPAAVFQGWGWLPLWWLALAFPYLKGRERAVAGALGMVALAVGPAVASLETRLRTARNPLFHAALSVVESSPAEASIAALEAAARQDPADRDLVYLLGTAHKRAGRYDDAADLYRRVLAEDPADAVARNNLANIEFVRGGYDAARARYRQGTGAVDSAPVVATSWYNLSLAYLQQFEYQAFNEAKSNADRLAGGLVADYDRWKYDSGDYAVVDLGLSREQVFEKFEGAESGVARRNVAGGEGGKGVAGTFGPSLLNRFPAALAVLWLVAVAVGRARGPKAFTVHCARCGTAFCRYCHLGQVSGGLCSQCYHIFVVRDGVSGPARNRKMAEVQAEAGRQALVFRIFSVVSPGAGQVYGGWTLRGAALLVLWYGVAGLLVAGRVAPLTGVPRGLHAPWPAVGAALVLGATWMAANRFRPEDAAEMPARPAGPRKARPTAAAG